jgi:hypothetical protein
MVCPRRICAKNKENKQNKQHRRNKMKFNKWTLGLAAVGVVSLTSAARADEKPSAVQTALSNTTISGYVSASANLGLTDRYAVSPAAGIPFQGVSKENGINLDVVKLSISKPEDATPWASGYDVDLLFGPDATGYNPSANSAGTADYSIKQAYVTLNTPVGNGLDFKVGVFDSPLGYEVFDAGSNPNYTRSYGYSIEPTELTGVLATYKINDAWSVSGGVVNTSAAGINGRNNESGNPGGSSWHEGYVADVTYTAPASFGWAAGSSAFAGVLYGYVNDASLVGAGAPSNAHSGYSDNNQVNYYAGLTLNTPWKQVTGGLAFDYVRNFDGGYESGGAILDVDQVVLGAYGTFKATDKLSLNARAEYLEADAYTGGNNKYAGSGNAIELTGTVEYDLWANVMTRVEVRWDQNLSKTTVGGLYSGYLPIGTTERDAVGLYANVIYKF